jgi:hypothetical protein
MNVFEAIANAEAILPGRAAPEGEDDPRWQAIIQIEDFIPEEPEAVWAFILRWGGHADDDLRDAIATVLLEHLLEQHFEDYFPGVTKAARENTLFGEMFCRCWKFGQSKEKENAERFDRLKRECQTVRKRD